MNCLFSCFALGSCRVEHPVTWDDQMLTDMKSVTDVKLSVHLSGGVFKGKSIQAAVVSAGVEMFLAHSGRLFQSCLYCVFSAARS
jgi:hypothetical protein